MSTILDRVSPPTREALISAAQSRGQLRPLCEELGLEYNSVRGALSRAGLYRDQAQDTLRTIAGVQPDETIRLEGEFTTWPELRDRSGLNADRSGLAECPPALDIVKQPQTLKLSKLLYQADAHAPLHDVTYIERLCRVGYHLEVEDLVIGGDFFDFDSLSAHGADIEQTDVNKSIEVAGEVLRYIKSSFKRVHILPGNHCRRLARKLDKNLAFRNLVKMAVGDLSGIVTTDDDYFLIDTPHGDVGWSVGHPRFFASYPTKGLDVVAMQRQRNVVGAHSHTFGLARVGPYLAISPGHMMRADLTPYLTRGNGLSKHPDQEPARGFVLIESTPREGDLVTMFGEGVTRWSDYR